MKKPNPCCQQFTVRRYAGTYNGIPLYESWCRACGRSAVPEGKMLVVNPKNVKVRPLRPFTMNPGASP